MPCRSGRRRGSRWRLRASSASRATTAASEREAASTACSRQKWLTASDVIKEAVSSELSSTTSPRDGRRCHMQSVHSDQINAVGTALTGGRLSHGRSSAAPWLDRIQTLGFASLSLNSNSLEQGTVRRARCCENGGKFLLRTDS